MTRERWEQILFAHVPDEVVQDMLNAYVLELEAENAELRELCADMLMSPQDYCEKYGIEYEGWSSADDHIDVRMRELGVGE